MDKLLKYLMLLLVTILSVTFVSCGGDDDEPEVPSPPSGQTSDIKKGSLGIGSSIALDVDNDGYNYIRFSLYETTVTVAKFDSKIVYIGDIQNLSEIKDAPSSGWDLSADLHNGGGYVISYVNRGVPKYIRLMLTLNMDATGAVVGANYAYQYFAPRNQ